MVVMITSAASGDCGVRVAWSGRHRARTQRAWRAERHASERGRRTAASRPAKRAPQSREVALGYLLSKPAAVEALDVGQEVVDHGVARRRDLDVELARTRRAVELPQLA